MKIFSQSTNQKNEFISLSAGKIFFGTGDIPGYAVNIEYERRLKTKSKKNSHFSYAVEIAFENGTNQPKIINPTFQEFISKTFHSTTNLILTPKVYYYPFSKTIAKGLNFSAGLSTGYTTQSREFQARYIYDSATQTSIRRSYLSYSNKVIWGYKINAGYDLSFSKRFLLGFRLSFSNYSNGDINTVIAGKAGYHF